MAEEKRRQNRWKLIINVLTLIALGLLLWLVWDEVVDSLHRLKDVNVWAILIMIPAQAWNFYAYARMYQDILSFLGSKVKTWPLYKIALELNFVNHVFPSGGVSGFSYFSLRLRSLKISTGKSTLVQMLRFVLIFISFQLLLLFGVTALAFSGAVNNFVLLTAGSMATLLIVGTVFIAFVIGSKRRISGFFTGLTKGINRLIAIFRPNHPETISIERAQRAFNDLHENYLLIKKDYGQLKRPLIDSLIANITEVVTLYVVFVAFGYWVNPGAVILAYAVANFAGLVAVLPGGVGVYEALMTAVLASAGVPVGVSLPVVIMYRVLTMLMQLPIGYVLYHKAVQDSGAKA